MLTKTLLQHLATESSYDRGESYFENDSVRKIKRDGNTFTAKVDGSQRYTVSLTLNTTGPEFTCSCPYGLSGICKHSVALGLAVIEEFGPNLNPAPSADAGIHWFTPTGEPADQPGKEDLWQRVSDDDKLRFVAQLLEKQPELRVQLALFAGATTPMPVGKPDTSITTDTVSTEVFELLSDLRFDEDTLEFDQDDWYSEESPDPTPIIAEVLQPYANQVSHALREGRLADSMTIYMGVYEGTQAATEPDHDEFDAIGNYPEETLGVWHELLQTTYSELALRVFSGDQLRQALQQLADRIRFFDDLEEEEDQDDEDYEEPIYAYRLKAFEPLLLALVTDEPSAQVMQEAIDRYGWQQIGTEYVQLRAADKRHDAVGWIRIADRFVESDLDIGLQLLDRYRLAGNSTAMLALLHRLSKSFPGKLDAFILQHLAAPDPTQSPERLGPDQHLYLDALANRCRQLGQLPDYLLLRTYLGPDQRKAFANGLVSQYGMGGSALFYAQVLHTENRTSDLWAWVEKTNWEYTRNMGDVLALTAESHPDECLALTRKKAYHWLETGKRDRGMYHVIADWVAGLNRLPTLHTQAITLAAGLVSHNPRLSALRSELKMKGLVR